MKKQKLFVLAASLLVLVAILATPLTGCVVSVNVSTASLSEATMCLSVDPVTMQPIEKADVFSVETPEIFCSVKLSNAPPDTKVTAVWVYVQGEVKDLENHEMGEMSMLADGTRYLYFSMTRPDIYWSAGDYEVKFFIDGKEKLTVPFKVQSEPSVSSGEVYLSEATMCLSVDPVTKQPIEKANVFSIDTPEIFCSVKLSNAPAGTQVTAFWGYVQGEIKDLKNSKISESTIKTEAAVTGYMSFSLTMQNNVWPRGDYVVILLLDGVEKFTVPFKVQ